jgi:hypothetical protein
MQYEKLNKEDFDAIVTGELTHYALWFEEELNTIIINYFGIKESRRDEFKRFILLRDGLTFQDKLEIVRGMLPLLGEAGESCNLKQLLKDVEEFKSWRNAMAHGQDVSDDEWAAKLKICVTTRSGVEKIIEITPDSHSMRMDDSGVLLEKLKAARETLKSV